MDLLAGSQPTRWRRGSSEAVNCRGYSGDLRLGQLPIGSDPVIASCSTGQEEADLLFLERLSSTSIFSNRWMPPGEWADDMDVVLGHAGREEGSLKGMHSNQETDPREVGSGTAGAVPVWLRRGCRLAGRASSWQPMQRR